VSLWLVTGGAGFIGSHLCDALLAAGDQVRVLDDLSTGQRANLPPSAELQVGCLTDPAAVARATDGVDGVFHLAAIASVEMGVQQWARTHAVNLSGTIGIFEALRRHGLRVPVVYASSAAVYGDCPVSPTPESVICRPLSAYGADKFGCEHHARVATHVHGIPTAGFRFFNVYGPRQNPKSPYSGVISIFCERLRAGQPIQIFGDGGQTRDFIHVSDIVAALMAGMRTRADGAPVFNVCTGRAVSVLELAETIGSLTGRAPDIRFQPPRAREIRHSLGDRTAIVSALGVGEPVLLRDGLRTVLSWLDQVA
jgi:UDP-glucose 4-epimerase